MPDSSDYPVFIQPAGWQFCAPPALSLVLAARQAGIRLPSSCRNGTCRACICQLASGTVSYVVERPGLSQDEREEGWILPCVARAESAVVLIVPKASRIEVAPGPPSSLTGARRA